jgi:hypothetical protein
LTALRASGRFRITVQIGPSFSMVTVMARP